jgi:hypothetical protein
MRRRDLFRRVGLIAAAVALAPEAGKAEAVPDHQGASYQEQMPQMIRGPALLTFEDMRRDCAARGCWLKRHEYGLWGGLVYTHPGFGNPAYQVSRATDPHIERVAEWRQRLHEQAVAQSSLAGAVRGRMETGPLTFSGPVTFGTDMPDAFARAVEGLSVPVRWHDGTPWRPGLPPD